MSNIPRFRLFSFDKEEHQPEKTPDSIVEQFLTSSLQLSSQVNYRKSWRIWNEYLISEQIELLKVTPLRAALYIKYYETRKGVGARFTKKDVTVTKATLRKEITVLKKLYDVIYQEKQIAKDNPFKELYAQYKNLVVKQSRPTEFIPFDKVMSLINAPSHESKRGLRDRALLALLFGGALRRSEVSKLDIGSLARDVYGNYTASLSSTKNGNDAEQPIADWATPYIEALLAQRLSDGANIDDPVFIDYRGDDDKAINRRLSDTSIYLRFKKYARVCGLGYAVSPHSARATTITKLLEDDVSRRDVMQFSRHSSEDCLDAYDKKKEVAKVRAAKKLSFP